VIIYYPFPPEIIEVITRPSPNPARMQPTNAKGDTCRKKNPIPRPRSNLPPIAHVLLSSFFQISPFFYSALFIQLLFIKAYLENQFLQPVSNSEFFFSLIKYPDRCLLG
jgi:hypothetical protein